MRKLPVDLTELEVALDNSSWEQIHAFDLETGQILFATAEDTREAEEIYEEIAGTEGGAFRYFRDVLSDHPEVRERWYEFKNASTRERALGWLREEGIEPSDA